MKGILIWLAACSVMLAAYSAAAQDPPAGTPPKPPAEYQAGGSFSGGVLSAGIVLSGIRFGGHDDFTRMVLDFEQLSDSGLRGDAGAHPVYSAQYLPYPYRIVLHMRGVRFDEHARVQTEDALPFSIVTQEDGTLKELQIFLAGPSEFKVIEIDDPAKLSIDVRPAKAAVPTVYAVQVYGPANASEAYALVEQGQFPAGFAPQVLVLGSEIVVEQAYTDPTAAAAADAALREMGYACVINERRGDELPAA